MTNYQEQFRMNNLRSLPPSYSSFNNRTNQIPHNRPQIIKIYIPETKRRSSIGSNLLIYALITVLLLLVHIFIYKI